MNQPSPKFANVNIEKCSCVLKEYFLSNWVKHFSVAVNFKCIEKYAKNLWDTCRGWFFKEKMKVGILMQSVLKKLPVIFLLVTVYLDQPYF